MAYTEYDLKSALPNKSYNSDGTTTDLLGNPVQNPVPEYEKKQSLPNKWLNPDGSYSTLLELISGAIDTELYVIVEELPQEGEPNKIYLLVDDDNLIEYLWVNNKWDPIGMIQFDISKYSTTEQMNAAIAAALNSAKAYADAKLVEAKAYTDQKSITFKAFPNEFDTAHTTQDFLDSVEALNLPVGMVYLGQVSLSDMPDGVTVQAEVEVYIYPQNTVYCIMRSAEIKPYIWECNSYEYRGWEPLSAGENIKIFYWTNENKLTFWNNVMKANDDSNVIVIWPNSNLIPNENGTMIYISSAPGEIRTNHTINAYSISTVFTAGNSYDTIKCDYRQYVNFYFTNDLITDVLYTVYCTPIETLSATKNYSTPYTPQYNGSPATKKYVDDSISTNITQALGGSY